MIKLVDELGKLKINWIYYCSYYPFEMDDIFKIIIEKSQNILHWLKIVNIESLIFIGNKLDRNFVWKMVYLEVLVFLCSTANVWKLNILTAKWLSEIWIISFVNFWWASKTATFACVLLTLVLFFKQILKKSISQQTSLLLLL